MTSWIRYAHVRVDEVLLLIQSIFSGPEPNSLDDRQHTRLFARCCSALELFRFKKLTLHTKDGFLHPAGFDFCTRSWVQTAQRPF